jgi:hypothetical protein
MRIDEECRDPELLVAEVRRLRTVIAAGETTLTDAEREAIEFFADIHADDDPPHEYAVILGKLLARLA